MADQQPNPPQAAHGERWGQHGAHVPKAQGLKRHGRGPRSCNTEGARDKQTNKLDVHYSKIKHHHCMYE